jgi:hypothetical protein
VCILFLYASSSIVLFDEIGNLDVFSRVLVAPKMNPRSNLLGCCSPGEPAPDILGHVSNPRDGAWLAAAPAIRDIEPGWLSRRWATLFLAAFTRTPTVQLGRRWATLLCFKALITILIHVAFFCRVKSNHLFFLPGWQDLTTLTSETFRGPG